MSSRFSSNWGTSRHHRSRGPTSGLPTNIPPRTDPVLAILPSSSDPSYRAFEGVDGWTTEGAPAAGLSLATDGYRSRLQPSIFEVRLRNFEGGIAINTGFVPSREGEMAPKSHIDKASEFSYDLASFVPKGRVGPGSILEPTIVNYIYDRGETQLHPWVTRIKRPRDRDEAEGEFQLWIEVEEPGGEL